MTDTPRSQAYLLGSEFQDGRPQGSITAQNVRDLIITVVPTGAVMTSGSSVLMTTTVLLINKTSGSATAVTLPALPIAYTQTYTIKDQKGDASANNITVAPFSGLIDGAASYVMNVSRQAASFIFDGTNWSLV